MRYLKLASLFVILLSCVFDSISQDRLSESDLIMNVQNRQALSLDGKWNIIVDPFEAGYLDYRLKPFTDPENSYAGNRKPQSPSDRIEYDFDKSPTINVPGDWNSQMEKLLYYEGTVWYKKSFEFRKKPGKRYFIYFGGVNYEANVYLNAKKVGDHTGGFTPFNFEITNQLNDGNNFLVLRVNNQRKPEGVPTVNFDWWNYGGITRSVYVMEMDEVFIQDYHIQLKKGSSDMIEGWVRLNIPKSGETLRIVIPEAGISESFQTYDNGVAAINITYPFKLWSPENPKLYDVHINFDQSVVMDQIGFRSIETKGYDILLNGDPIFLRGVCIHEEAPFEPRRAFTKEDAQTLLTWAKELGCNFVRLAHYTHNENMIREADRLGLMVWSEVPVYWTIHWNNEQTFNNAKNQLHEAINRDRNRASIILWSMANETPPGDSRTKFISGLAREARILDPSRLITAALEVHTYPNDPNTVVLEDPLAEYLDVYGCNEYAGWYWGPPEKALELKWTTKYEKPLVISEFGGGAMQGYYGRKDDRWTENYQDEVYRTNLIMLDNIGFLSGTTPWILKDFRSPKRVLPGIQDGWNRKGLISDRGVKKLAFYRVQEWYLGKSEN